MTDTDSPLQIRTPAQRKAQLDGERLLRQAARKMREGQISLEEAKAHFAAHWRSTIKQDSVSEADRNWANDPEITG